MLACAASHCQSNERGMRERLIFVWFVSFCMANFLFCNELSFLANEMALYVFSPFASRRACSFPTHRIAATHMMTKARPGLLSPSPFQIDWTKRRPYTLSCLSRFEAEMDVSIGLLVLKREERKRRPRSFAHLLFTYH